MNKSYLHIISKIMNDTWSIRPEVFNSILNIIETRLAGEAMFNSEIFESEVIKGEDEEEYDYVQNGIRVIRANGIIGKHLNALEIQCGGLSLDQLSNKIKDAINDSLVKKVLIYMNSPGGTVVGVPELANVIYESPKPIYVFSDYQLASAAYWIASQADGIFITPSSYVGGIGVYCLILDETKRNDMAGIKYNAVYRGKYKLLGASFKPLDDEEKKIIEERVNNEYNEFVTAILRNREVDPAALQGLIYKGNEAVSMGLADGLVNDMNEIISMIID